MLTISVLLLGTTILVAAFKLIKLIKKANKEIEAQEQEEKRRQEEYEYSKAQREYYYNIILESEIVRGNKSIDIRNIPKLSFSQWLSFYKIAPERWELNLNECNIIEYGYQHSVYSNSHHIHFAAFPTYIKNKVKIDTFWETPEDLEAFMQWQKNEYKNGNAAIFEQARNKELAKLTKYLREDIQEKNIQFQKELDELEQQVIAAMPQPSKTLDPIQQYMQSQSTKN